jgi:hypothetical protein
MRITTLLWNCQYLGDGILIYNFTSKKCMSSPFEISAATGSHLLFKQMEGNWQGITKTWFEPDVLADESQVQANIHLILGGRFLMMGYAGSLQGRTLEGLMIIGKQLSINKFQSVWLDSFHTGTDIMFSESKRDAHHLSVLGTYLFATPEKEEIWGWRTRFELVNTDKLIITAFNVSPSGEESKATETTLIRIK